MRNIQIDPADLMVLHPDQHDFLRAPDEKYRRRRIKQKSRNADRPAALLRDRRDASRGSFVVGALERLARPRQQDRIAQVRDPEGRVRIAWILVETDVRGRAGSDLTGPGPL